MTATLMAVFALCMLTPRISSAQIIDTTPGFQGIYTSPDPFRSPWSQPIPGPNPTTSQTAPTTVTQAAAAPGPGPTVSITGYCSNFSAATLGSSANKLADILKYFTCMIQRMIVPLLMALGGLFFIVGMVKFITSGEAEARAEGKQFMIWGVVGFAVIFSVWGIFQIFKQTISLDNAAPTVPTAPTAIHN